MLKSVFDDKLTHTMLSAVVLICFISCFLQPSDSARILGIVPIPSYSHQVAYRPLWRELSLRGHQLTVLTTDPMNDPSLTNLTEIDLHFGYELWNKILVEMVNEENFLKMLLAIAPTLNAMVDQLLQHPPVKALIKNETEHFDLLMMELMPLSLAFSERFKCPIIVLTSFDPPSIFYEMMGNPTHPVANPDIHFPFLGKLTFWQRLLSSLFHVGMTLFLKLVGFGWQQQLVEKHFGDGYSQLDELVSNISLLFVSTDPVLHQVRPLVPAVIQIGGGTHRQPPKPLPKDLRIILDDATEGFIYFSLGTNVKSTDLSKSNIKIILETFAELPYFVLWKFDLESEDLLMQPKNVLISKWFPQQDIFKHPNIKLFITQGGQQSMEEAIFDNIPIVGMPFFGDQLNIVARCVAKGLGLSLDHKNLDKGDFKNTILEVINNPKYRHKVQEVAALAKDQPMTGLEKAVWWTEYVLRHKGAKHLRSPAIDIPLYQYLLLDVIGVCLLILLITVYLLIKLIRLSVRALKYVTPKRKTKLN